jgi:hypothetical protein
VSKGKRPAGASAAEELASLFPQPKLIPVHVRRQGEAGSPWEAVTISVEPMTIEQIGRMIAALGPVASGIEASPSVIALAANYPREIMGAIAVAIGWTTDDVAAIDGAGFIDVATAVWESNEDFFGRRLVPLVLEHWAMAAARNGGGARRSDSSVATAASGPSDSPSASLPLQ